MTAPDQIAVVTGASSGIGLALARRLAADGTTVVLADLVEGPAVQLADGTPARFVRTDVSVEAEVEALIEDVLSREGRIDLFASNVGIGGPMDATADAAKWQRVIDVNLLSHVNAVRRLVPAMIAAGGGRILITASAAGLLGSITSVGYAVTKAACVALAEWLSFTYRDQGISVSVLCPGAVRTPMIDGIPYLQADAIEPDAVATAAVEGLASGRFMITTHPTTLPMFRQKAADHDAFLALLTNYRRSVLAMS